MYDEDLLEAALPRTKIIYVADVKSREGGPVLPGDGVVPLSRVIRYFQKSGFVGFFSFKWEKIWRPEIEPPEKAFPEFVRFMNSVNNG